MTKIVNEAAFTRAILKGEPIIGEKIIIRVKKVSYDGVLLDIEILDKNGGTLIALDNTQYASEGSTLTIIEPAKMFEVTAI